MSRFLSNEALRLAPYTPGEQPTDTQYVKLNTNESPFPPSPAVLAAVSQEEVAKLKLYSDPTCGNLNCWHSNICYKHHNICNQKMQRITERLLLNYNARILGPRRRIQSGARDEA